MTSKNTYFGYSTQAKLVDAKNGDYLPWAKSAMKDGKIIFTIEKGSTPDKKCFRYAVANSYDDILTFMQKLKPQYRTINEHIPPNMSQKMVFDIDKEGKYGSSEKAITIGKRVVADLYKNIKENYEAYGYNIGPNDILVTEACMPTKISFHIVVDKILFPNYYEVQDLALRILANVDPKYTSYHDRGIYKKRHNLRILSANKEGKNNHLKKIQVPLPGGKKSGIRDDINYFVCSESDTSILVEPNTDFTFGRVEAVNPIYFDDDLVQQVMEKFSSLELSKQFEYHSFSSPFINLKRVTLGHCPICVREHDGFHTHSNYLVISKFGGVHLRCHRDFNGGSQKIIDCERDIEEKKEELKLYLDKNLFREDEGFADIIEERKRDSIVTLENVVNGGYVYDEITALWKRSSALAIRNTFSPTLECMIIAYEERINDILAQIDEAENVLDTPLREELEEKKKMLKVIKKKILTDRQCMAIYNKVSSRLHDPSLLSKLDQTPYLLPIQNNKVVDLRTGIARKRTKNDLFSIECPVSLEEDEYQSIKSAIVDGKKKPSVADKRKRVEDYFNSLFGSEEGLVNYMQTFLGYCLTGETSDRGFYCLSGVGFNGKSKLIEIMKRLLGGFFTLAEYTLLLSNKNNNESRGGANPFLLEIGGKSRMVVLSEPDRKAKLNTGIIKLIASGDATKTRKLYSQDTNDVNFRCKLTMDTNYLPNFDGTDNAMQDRLRVVPFVTRFRKAHEEDDGRQLADDSIIDSLNNELLNAFFAYILEGSVRYYSIKSTTKFIPLPKCMLEAGKSYVSDNDPITSFSQQCIEKAEGKNIPVKECYEAFRNWCYDNGIDYSLYNSIAFYKEMPKLGYVKGKVQQDKIRVMSYKNVKIVE